MNPNSIKCRNSSPHGPQYPCNHESEVFILVHGVNPVSFCLIHYLRNKSVYKGVHKVVTREEYEAFSVLHQ